MQVARSPTGSQRRQEYVKAIGVEPAQTPAESVSGVSTTGESLEICGVDVTFAASAMTTADDSEFCGVVPCEFVAVTCTRSRVPTSAF